MCINYPNPNGWLKRIHIAEWLVSLHIRRSKRPDDFSQAHFFQRLSSCAFGEGEGWRKGGGGGWKRWG